MTEGNESHPGQDPHQPSPSGPFSQDIHHTPIAARVPEDIGRGVFCDAVLILQTNDVFVLDFLSTVAPPQQIGARVILTAWTYSETINALRTNVTMFERNFGPLKPRTSPPPSVQPAPGATPQPQGGKPGETAAPVAAGSGAQSSTGGNPPSAEPGKTADSTGHVAAVPHPRAEELYDQLKAPDKLLGGSFANVVMIRHTHEEFCIDFVANFYPRAVVTARVFMSAGRIPSLLDTMSGSLEGFRQKFGWPPRPQGPAV